MAGAIVDTSLNELVAALPDLYQPVFGHPDLSAGSTRLCHDRLSHIVPVYEALAACLKRPLRVLDLGCAQGFFCFHLAGLGATAHGVDFLDRNIAVCEALAAEHPKLKVSFETGSAAEAIGGLADDRYDMVLGLSIVHHLIHDAGLAAVQGMLAKLAHAVGAGVFELAFADEPTKLRYAGPANPRELLDAFSFVRELARIPTQMAFMAPSSAVPTVIARPLYVASARYRFDNGSAETLPA